MSQPPHIEIRRKGKILEVISEGKYTALISWHNGGFDWEILQPPPYPSLRPDGQSDLVLYGIYSNRGALIGLWCHKWVDPDDIVGRARVDFHVHVESEWIERGRAMFKYDSAGTPVLVRFDRHPPGLDKAATFAISYIDLR